MHQSLWHVLQDKAAYSASQLGLQSNIFHLGGQGRPAKMRLVNSEV